MGGKEEDKKGREQRPLCTTKTNCEASGSFHVYCMLHCCILSGFSYYRLCNDTVFCWIHECDAVSVIVLWNAISTALGRLTDV